MILNSSHVAGVSIKDFYSVDISDGIFEAVLIERPENLLTLEQSFSALRRGETKGPGFEVIRGSEFEIKTEQPVKWTLDGEFGGKVSEVRIKVVPRAVTFIGKGNN
jgi:diacylglycerol kinase family enzyme